MSYAWGARAPLGHITTAGSNSTSTFRRAGGVELRKHHAGPQAHLYAKVLHRADVVEAVKEDARCGEEDLRAFEVNASLLDEEGAVWDEPKDTGVRAHSLRDKGAKTAMLSLASRHAQVRRSLSSTSSMPSREDGLALICSRVASGFRR